MIDSTQTSSLPAIRRIASVQDPVIPIVGRWIAQHPGTISLGQGVVHYGPPPQTRQAIEEFWRQPAAHKYTPFDGLADLKSALAAKLQAENGIHLGDARSLLVTAGANLAFFTAILAITDPGDEVILIRPFYFNHEMALTMLGCKPVIVESDAAGQPHLSALREAITPRTRAIVTISPNNPTGAVYAPSLLRQINDLCAAQGIHHISDEAYEYFTFDQAAHFSPGSLECSPQATQTQARPHTFSIFSLSKSHGMASWRLGYMVYPADLQPAIQKIQDTHLICPPAISQWAALGCLRASADYCRSFLPDLSQVRQHILQTLHPLRRVCRLWPAQGAFYFLLDIDAPLSSMELSHRLIRDFGVALIPASTFGLNQTAGLRLSYGALDSNTVRQGIDRLAAGLRSILGA